MKQYNKLVRDKIPEICESNSDTPNTRILDDDVEYLESLGKKYVEEVAEVMQAVLALCVKLGEQTEEAGQGRSREELVKDLVSELADARQVDYAITDAIGLTSDQIEAARVQKAAERGGFEKRIFLISTD